MSDLDERSVMTRRQVLHWENRATTAEARNEELEAKTGFVQTCKEHVVDDTIECPLCRIKELEKAAIAVRDDLLMRAKMKDPDHIVVDVSRTIWEEFKEALGG